MSNVAGETFLVLTLSTAAKYVFLYAVGYFHRYKKTLRPIGKLSRIIMFPAKSMRGLDVTEGQCTYTGITVNEVHDRSFMVTNSDYEFVTARTISKLTIITAQVENSKLVLSCPNANTIQANIPDPTVTHTVTASLWESTIEAVDCGNDVAIWLQKVLGKTGLRLLYHSKEMTKISCQDIYKNDCLKPEDQVAFQDGFPYMLMSEPSVRELNSRLELLVEIDNFRPNLVVDGCKAYDEDTWDRIRIGEVEFINAQPCQRCVLTTVNPVTGERHPQREPLHTLRQYRMQETELGDVPMFGVNLTLVQPGTVHEGDTVYASLH